VRSSQFCLLSLLLRLSRAPLGTLVPIAEVFFRVQSSRDLLEVFTMRLSVGSKNSGFWPGIKLQSSPRSRTEEVPGAVTTLNTAYTVGHTIFSTLYSVGKLDEQ
jgi:hypothetical protein